MLRLAAAIVIGSAAAAGAWAGETTVPPGAGLDQPAMVEAGKTRFNAACTYCHGAEGEGGKTPNFRGRHDLDASSVFNVISNGRTRGANIMPAWKGSLDEQARWELVAYILSLEAQPARD